MTVNSVFGRNLRLLANRQGSLTSVAAELGISRVQFQRYLKGESFPKPNLLLRICTHFGVDARILLEPVDGIAPAGSEARPGQAGGGAGPARDGRSGMDDRLQQILGSALRGHDYALPQHVLSDGIYRCWVGEAQKQDTFYCMAVQVGCSKTERATPLHGAPATARFTRSYFDRAQFSGLSGPELKQRREVRGAMLGLPDGMLWLAVNPAPIYRITLAHFAPNPVVANGSFVGFLARGRAELPGFSRVARAFLEPVPRQIREVLARCKTKPVYSASEVPEAVLEHIQGPVEWRGHPFGG